MISMPKIIPLILLLVGLSNLAQVTNACSCIAWGLQYSYHQKGMEVMKVKVLANLKYKQKRKYVARVLKNYSNLNGVRTTDFIFISSPMTSCETYLGKGTWVVATKKTNEGGPAMYSTYSCDYHKRWKQLDSEELAFLNTRMICDGNQCECADGSDMYVCITHPCNMKCSPNTTCTANYCGGCRGEYTDDSGVFQCQCMQGDPTCPAKS